MFVMGIDPDDLPQMEHMARMFETLDKLDLTVGETAPDLLPTMLDYINERSTPDITTEEEIRQRLWYWLDTYLKFFAPRPNAPGVDTPQ